MDFDALRQELSDYIVEGPKERYQFTWPDKSKAKLLANTPTTMTLRPCREESVDFDNTKNLYIEGDNLEVLKILRETYLGKVKMIYIDPPYNTGNDFIYNDDFSMSSKEYDEISGNYDDEGNRLIKNVNSNGRFHTDWLNMMYPRLKVARDLLADDGVIFISIDDNELVNLRKILDEIFGPINFVAQIMPITNPGGRDYNQVAITHEYLLIYSKSNLLELNEIVKECKFKFTDSNGGYELRELRNRNPKFTRANRPNLFYPFYVNPNNINENGYCTVSLEKSNEYYVEVCPYNSLGIESVWRWGKLKSSLNIVHDDADASQILAKQKGDGNWNIYEKNRRSTTKIKSIWDETNMRTEDGTRLIRFLMGATVFDHPKSLDLLKRCCEVGSDSNSIIMDFFSGSATLAHAVTKLNSEDGGSRSCISIQFPEPCSFDSVASSFGYENICEIGKERIRRAGKQIKEESGKEDLDIGFRVFKLDSSNMKDVFYGTEDTKNTILDDFVDNIKSDRTPEDLLFQAMLECPPLDLSSKVEVRDVDSSKVFIVDDGYLAACFDDSISEDVITSIAKDVKPTYAVFRDGSMTDDAMLSNIEQIFKTYSPVTEIRVL